MAAVASLEERYRKLAEDMFSEGLLDEQFVQLQQLQDPSNPGFVAEVVTLFFQDSEKILEDITKLLQCDPPVDYNQVDGLVHQFKGSSSSIGAGRIKSICINFRAFCDSENKDGCLDALRRVTREFRVVKERLETLLQLEEQIMAAGGTVPQFE